MEENFNCNAVKKKKKRDRWLRRLGKQREWKRIKSKEKERCKINDELNELNEKIYISKKGEKRDRWVRWMEKQRKEETSEKIKGMKIEDINSTKCQKINK